ncbi:MAG: CAP domain-containing protein [Acidobacteria bacterium]|nr:CAP domain-containing protein [Acidobacteriota bacterium]
MPQFRFFSLLLIISSTACAVRIGAQQPTVAERFLFEAANQERRAAGLQTLQWNPRLAQSARRHAQSMAEHHALSHQFSGEDDVTSRAATAIVHFSEIAENVGVAPSPLEIHAAWMVSPDHRKNILDPNLTSLGVSVVYRSGSLWAVQDFAHDVQELSFMAQEQRVGNLLSNTGKLHNIVATEAARQSCTMKTGYAGDRRPWFVVRYVASDLSRLPEQLMTRLNTGRYTQAAVGACPLHNSSFSGYHIAVLLYP